MKWLAGILALIVAGGVGLVFGLESGDAAASVALNPNHECTYCHGLHSGVSNPLLNEASVEATCLSCHGPGGIAIEVDVHRNDNMNSCCAPFRVTCDNCHDPHDNPTNWRGNQNLKLVLAEITPPGDTLTVGGGGPRQVVFENLSGDFSFCDQEGPNGVPGYPQPDGAWDNVCDVCHANWDLDRHHYDADLTSNNHHQNGATCTNCHEHVTGFNP